MPVKRKEVELDDGRKIWVRQASGMDKLKIEAKQGRVLRKVRHFGVDMTAWTEEQQDEFLELCDAEGCGFTDQVEAWVPKCVLDDVDTDSLTSDELVRILNVIRGEDTDDVVPLA